MSRKQITKTIVSQKGQPLPDRRRFRFARRAAAIRTLLDEGWSMTLFREEGGEVYQYAVEAAALERGQLLTFNTVGWTDAYIEDIRCRRAGEQVALVDFFVDAPQREGLGCR